MIATIVLLALSLNASANESLNEQVAVKVSAYTLKEINANRGRTASGKRVKVGYIAISRDLEQDHGLKFGDKITIKGLGEFEIQDRTSSRKEKWIDVYMTSYRKAKQFGIKRLTMIITKVA